MKAPLFIAALCVCITVASGQSESDSIQKYQDQLKENPRDSLAHYLLAEISFQQKNYQKAANEFRESLNGNLQPRWVEVWAHLGLAKTFELSGQHDRAVNEYRLAARTHDNTKGAQEVVTGYLEQENIASHNTDELQTTFPAAFRLGLTPLGPEPTHKTEPDYSEEARAAGLEGTVFVSLAIGLDGTPGDLRVKSPLGLGLDEKALDAVTQWRFTAAAQGAQSASALVAVNFLLSSKLSRWHLVGAWFQPPEGVSRPVFLTEPYPLGAGISNKAIDEGQVIAAIHRSATVTLQFDIDDSGMPANFQVLGASAPVWGDEAIAVVRNWRFAPGVKDGEAVIVPCTLDLVWGQKIWTPESLAQMRKAMSSAARSDEQVVVRPNDAPRPPKIKSLYEIEDSTPRSPYSVVLSVIIGEDGVPTNLNLIRTLGPEYSLTAIVAVLRSQFKPPVLNGTPVAGPALIEVDF
jgi:TonB family protein